MTQTVSGFTIPAGSDQVSSIDDTLVTFAGEVRAAINAAASELNVIDAKGDLVVGSADNTPIRLAVGTNGQILQADSTASGGVKWADASAGGMTLLHTVALTGGSTITQSGISNAYKHLLLVFNNVSAAGGDDFNIRFNGDTGTNYRWWNQWAYTSMGSNGPVIGAALGLSIRTASSNSWDAAMGGHMWLYDYTRTTGVSGHAMLDGKDGSGNLIFNRSQFTYNTASAGISSISFIAPTTFDQGNIYIYGVK